MNNVIVRISACNILEYIRFPNIYIYIYEIKSLIKYAESKLSQFQ